MNSAMGSVYPEHPGVVLGETIETLGVSVAACARGLDIPVNRLRRILAGERMLCADTALRLGVYFGQDPEEWVRAQASYDLGCIEREAGAAIRARVRRRAAAAAPAGGR